jgi:hypothetical protein
MSLIDEIGERIRSKLPSAPTIEISSNVLLSKEERDHIRENGQEAADEIAAKLQEARGFEVKIRVEGVRDTDVHALNWSGPRL